MVRRSCTPELEAEAAGACVRYELTGLWGGILHNVLEEIGSSSRALASSALARASVSTIEAAAKVESVGNATPRGLVHLKAVGELDDTSTTSSRAVRSSSRDATSALR